MKVTAKTLIFERVACPVLTVSVKFTGMSSNISYLVRHLMTVSPDGDTHSVSQYAFLPDRSITRRGHNPLEAIKMREIEDEGD